MRKTRLCRVGSAGCQMTRARLLITGSRTWTDQQRMYDALFTAYHELMANFSEVVLVHGGAEGADRMAASIWSRNSGMPIENHRAMWEVYGRRAGFQRNQEMVALGAELMLAFIKDNSAGASQCAALAEAAGIPVRYFREVSNLGQSGDDNDNTACV